MPCEMDRNLAEEVSALLKSGDVCINSVIKNNYLFLIYFYGHLVCYSSLLIDGIHIFLVYKNVY